MKCLVELVMLLVIALLLFAPACMVLIHAVTGIGGFPL